MHRLIHNISVHQKTQFYVVGSLLIILNDECIEYWAKHYER